MKRSMHVAVALAMLVAGAPAPAQPRQGLDASGLAPVTAAALDESRAAPGADFRPYRKVLLRAAAVSLREGWLRDMNDRRIPLERRARAGDAEAVANDARAGFDAAWNEAFRAAGYEVVATPGDGVLEVSPKVTGLSVNVPDVGGTAIARSYAREAGDATLDVEFRDSRSGALLARMADHRHAMRSATPQRTDAVAARADMDALYAAWARDCLKELGELRAGSPLARR